MKRKKNMPVKLAKKNYRGHNKTEKTSKKKKKTTKRKTAKPKNGINGLRSRTKNKSIKAFKKSLKNSSRKKKKKNKKPSTRKKKGPVSALAKANLINKRIGARVKTFRMNCPDESTVCGNCGHGPGQTPCTPMCLKSRLCNGQKGGSTTLLALPTGKLRCPDMCASDSAVGKNKDAMKAQLVCKKIQAMCRNASKQTGDFIYV